MIHDRDLLREEPAVCASSSDTLTTWTPGSGEPTFISGTWTYPEAAKDIIAAIDPMGSIDALNEKIKELDARADALEKKADACEAGLKAEMIKSIQFALEKVGEVAKNDLLDIEKAGKGLEGLSAGEIARAAVVRGAQAGAAAVVATLMGVKRREWASGIDYMILMGELQEIAGTFNLDKSKIVAEPRKGGSPLFGGDTDGDKTEEEKLPF